MRACCVRCAGYYAVDAKAETAMNGNWKKGPGTELFAALEKVSRAPPGLCHQAPPGLCHAPGTSVNPVNTCDGQRQ